MRGLLSATIAIVFQLTYFGLLRSVFLGVGVRASEVEGGQVMKRMYWNDLLPRGTWHAIVARQQTSGNRTKDLYDFFSPNDPPAQCSLDCELIWGAVSACEFRSCLCTEQYGHEFERCVDCVAPGPTPTQTDYYQGILNEFQTNYCAGYHMSPLTFNTGASGATTTVQPIVSTSGTSSIATATGGGDGPVGTTGSGSSSGSSVPNSVTSGATFVLPKVTATVFLTGIVGLSLW
ncbi:hypothetical protein AN958_11226 [Leucoagaricus sp. SymC.cos]|nr:hypothetical protein AN958_11226 [Leucoagaricus sp. SymC.cos]